MNKKYPNNKSYALQPIENVLTPEAIDKSIKHEINTLASGYLLNENGTFNEFVKFNKALQLAPINSMSEANLDSISHLVIAGNSLRVNTYHGGYTSLKGLFLKNKDAFDSFANLGLDPLHGEIKATAVVKMKFQDLLLIIANNDSLKTYSFNHK